jgi:hypothetical protein
MSAACRAAALAKRHAARIRELQQQINGYRGKLEQTQQRVNELKQRLQEAVVAASAENTIQSPSERIYNDIIMNHDRPPTGRRYSFETLLWAQEIHAISPHALAVVRKVIPLPGEPLLSRKFTQQRRLISEALQDENRLGEMMELWERGLPQDAGDRSLILAVDAVAFRPVITVDEDGFIHGLKDQVRLDDQDLFDTFLKHPPEFAQFLSDHWDQAYSSLFVYHIQPVNPRLPCAVIHVVPAVNGKGNPKTVGQLSRLEFRLKTAFRIPVVGVAFDGDSAFNQIHTLFASDWKRSLNHRTPSIPRFPDLGVVICDPKHLAKRVRYRWVEDDFSVGTPGNGFFFSLARIRDAGLSSPVVFVNSQESKMHDSLPLELFSPKTLVFILTNDVEGENVMVPWCLLVTALTVPELSTKMRADVLEVGFWMLFIYENFQAPARRRAQQPLQFPKPPETPRRRGGPRQFLYTDGQLRDALNTFVSLIILIERTQQPFCLNRFGSDPLEHAFGQARIRSKDVNSMKKMVRSFAVGLISSAVERFLELAARPRRRISVGLDCPPIDPSEQSIFQFSPKTIAISLLIRSRHLAQTTPAYPAAWEELKKIPGLPTLELHESDVSVPSPEPIKPRTLSSNQLFLGLLNSPRPLSLITAPSKMARALNDEFNPVESGLETIYGTRLNMPDLESVVRRIARDLNIDPPDIRRRNAYLAWIRENWTVVREPLGQAALERRQAVTHADGA